jgi:hypothetical protein
MRLSTGHMAHRGSRGIAVPFLEHGTRRGWGDSATPRPLFTHGKDLAPIVQKAGWAQGQSGQVRKILLPLGFDPWTVQPVASRYTDYATRSFVTVHHDQNFWLEKLQARQNLSEANTDKKIILKLIVQIIKDKHWTKMLQYQLLWRWYYRACPDQPCLFF